MKAQLKMNNSIRNKTLFHFFSLVIIILGIVWITEVLFLESIYENIKTKEISKSTENIVEIYLQDENFKNELQDLAFQNDVNIVIFRIENKVGKIIYQSSRFYNSENMNNALNSMLSSLGSEMETNYIEDTRSDFKSLTYGKRVAVDGDWVYFYVNTPIVPIASTTEILTTLLLIISVIAFAITITISMFFANNISKPLVDISEKAKELSKGNLDFKFNNKEYAEVAQLSDTLNYAIEEMKKTDNLKKEFMSNVSHELKTPLTMIKSYTELIKDINGDNKEKREQNLQVILDETEKLNFLVDDILDLTKLESGDIEYEPANYNLSEALLKTIDKYSTQYQNSEYKFTTQIPKKVFINADEKRINQVVTNLLNNAINYSKDDKNISIKLIKQTNTNIYRLEIKDHGIGISEENQKLIFSRHFRSNEAKRVSVGNGIGLSIVKQILDAHKFTYGVKSKINKGSTFYIDFPTIINKDNISQ